MYAWFINPLVTYNVLDEFGQPTGKTYQKPRVATFIDPTTGKTFLHTSSIGIGSWVLSLVRGGDFSELIQDPACELIFDVPVGTHPEVFLDMTLIDLELTQGEINNLRSRMNNAGIENSDLAESDSTELWLNRISSSQGGGNARGMYV